MNFLLAVGYLFTIIGANWAIATFGLVPMGFGLIAPAGVFFAGLALGLRDAVQERHGRRIVVSLIVLGALLSGGISPEKIAIASGLAFLVSEFIDYAVYTPLRKRGWEIAVLISGIVGAVVDSVIFLGLAFGDPFTFLPGQLLGKFYATAGAIIAVRAWLLVRNGKLVFA